MNFFFEKMQKSYAHVCIIQKKAVPLPSISVQGVVVIRFGGTKTNIRYY